jgi:hypothetical protein
MAKLTVDEMWRQMLTGDYPRLHRMRKMWGALPRRRAASSATRPSVALAAR